MALDLGAFVTGWNYPTSMLYGTGTAAKVAQACERAGISRPLLVTDPGLAALPVLASIKAPLDAAGLVPVMFTGVKPNPLASNVEAGVEMLRKSGCDGVVALGGGSALDVGKCIAFMAGQSRPIWDFEDIGDYWTRADGEAILPIIAIPTTAGTGSEVGRAGVITDAATHRKKVIFHPKMMPRTAILDPALTVGLPPALTAGTGMDALAHCLEAYCAPGYHPMAEGIAVEGIRLVKECLPTAYRHGGDLAARGMMLTASAMGATAFQKGLGAIHALSHPVGANFDTHHGTTNAVVMPYVLVFNRPAIEARIDRLAAWLGIAGGFDGFLAWVMELRHVLQIPQTLADLGVPAGVLESLVPDVLDDPTAGGNPITLDKASALRLLQDAHQGRGLPGR